MALFLTLCLLMSSAYGLPDAVRPGALVAPEGTVLVVEDVVNVVYDIQPLHGVAERIPLLGQAVLDLHEVFERVLSGTKDISLDPALNSSLQIITRRVKTLKGKTQELANVFPANSVDAGRKASSDRPKRGLFDLGGMLLKTVFGTAMSSDVAALGERLNTVSTAVESQGRVLWQEHLVLRNLKDKLNVVIDQVNELSMNVNALSFQLATLENMVLLGLYIDNLEDSISVLHKHSSALMNSLVNAGLNKVNSQLLPLEHLRAAIHFARANFSLTPFFTEEEIEFYYPLIESTLTDSQVLIHIPLKSDISYSAYSVTSFPMLVNDSLLSLVSHANMFLVAEDYMLVSLTDRSTIAKCRSSYSHLFVCPAYLFALLPAQSAPCELAIVRNNTEFIHAHCTFKPVESTWPVYHAHVGGVQYFYFRDAASVTLICNGKSTNVIAQGYYAAKDSCEVRSSTITTLPSRQHLGFESELPSSLVPLMPSFGVNLANLTVVSEKLTMLSFLNDTDVFVAAVPLYLRPHVMAPLLSLPMIILVIVVVLLCVCLTRFKLVFETSERLQT